MTLIIHEKKKKGKGKNIKLHFDYNFLTYVVIAVCGKLGKNTGLPFSST